MNSNLDIPKHQTSGQLILTVSWWLLNIPTACLGVYLMLNLEIREDALYLLFLWIILLFLVVAQIISKIGLSKVSYSKGWAVWFICLGVFSLFSIFGILILIGGIIALNDINSAESLSLLIRKLS